MATKAKKTTKKVAKTERTFANGVFIREVVFEDGNSLLNVAVQAKAFCEFMQEHVNEKGYVNLEVRKNNNPEAKFSHSMVLNEYNPQKNAKQAIEKASKDMPF
tara:strand:- start:170 stop:478 length:309 start_codon:yes stop_codon:yes gene_type:complete